MMLSVEDEIQKTVLVNILSIDVFDLCFEAEQLFVVRKKNCLVFVDSKFLSESSRHLHQPDSLIDGNPSLVDGYLAICCSPKMRVGLYITMIGHNLGSFWMFALCCFRSSRLCRFLYEFFQLKTLSIFEKLIIINYRKSFEHLTHHFMDCCANVKRFRMLKSKQIVSLSS